MTGVLIRRKGRDTDGWWPWEDQGRDWSDATTAKECQGHQKLEGAWKDPPLKALGRAQPCQYLDFKLLAPEL